MTLPKSVPSPLGPVRVVRATGKKLGNKRGEEVFGDFSWLKRRIRVRDDLKGVVARQVLWHEWTHMVLADAGLRSAGLAASAEEVLCDAVANAMCMQERTGRSPGVR